MLEIAPRRGDGVARRRRDRRLHDASRVRGTHRRARGLLHRALDRRDGVAIDLHDIEMLGNVTFAVGASRRDVRAAIFSVRLGERR